MAVPTGTKNAQTLGAAGAPITLADGTVAYALMTIPVDSTGTPSSGTSPSNTYTLANNITLAGNTSTTPVAIPANSSASYGFSYILGGTSPNMKLQALGADATTWQDVVTGITASGQQGVVVFTGAAGASLRLTNTTANSITGLTATLSS